MLCIHVANLVFLAIEIVSGMGVVSSIVWVSEKIGLIIFFRSPILNYLILYDF